MTVPLVKYTIAADGGYKKSGELRPTAPEIVISTVAPDQPGFLRLVATACSEDGKPMKTRMNYWGNMRTVDLAFDGGLAVEPVLGMETPWHYRNKGSFPAGTGPEGVAIGVPILYATGSRRKAFLYSLLSGLAEPAGALIGFLILAPFLTPAILAVVFAVISGIMVYISFDELLPMAETYGQHHIVLAGLLLGMLGIGYTQNGFGVDLLREKRPCMFFTGDNLIGVRDSSRLYIYFPDSRQELCYRTDGFRMEKAAADSAFLNLRHYGFSMLQCAETLVQRGQTLDHQEEQKAQ